VRNFEVRIGFELGRHSLELGLTVITSFPDTMAADCWLSGSGRAGSRRSIRSTGADVCLAERGGSAYLQKGGGQCF
jgi:hypothetical protein